MILIIMHKEKFPYSFSNRYTYDVVYLITHSYITYHAQEVVTIYLKEASVNC